MGGLGGYLKIMPTVSAHHPFVASVFLKVTEENGEQMPCYFVMVSLQEVGGVETKNWTVPRRLSEFQNLHRKLSEV